jgi:hypothetical protein
VDPQTHVAFAVRLIAFRGNAQLFAEGLQSSVDVFEGGRPVLNRIAFAEHVVVDAVQHQKLFHEQYL